MRTAWRAATACVAAAGTLLTNPGARAQPTQAETLPPVEVIGISPLAGSDQPLREVAGNVRIYSASQLGGGPGVAGFLGDRAASFTAEDAQGNRSAAEISYRGFSASPLLGAAQGLSVFLDGVRVNEAFGDIVNWDLIPRNAIATVSVMPGSNAVFGLNTLGGALALTTKSGETHPGTELDASFGNWGRRSIEVARGDSGQRVDGFVAASVHDDGGWREHSATRLRQIFGQLGWRDDRTRLRMTINAADNSLSGTQALPASFLDAPRAAYTWPDWTTNRLLAINLTGAHAIGSEHSLSANVFARQLRTEGFNSNVNDACIDANCIGNALNDAFDSDERRVGAGLQWLWHNRLAGFRNRTLSGATFEVGRVHFIGREQAAQFDATRGTKPLAGFEVTAAARTEHRYRTLFVTDTLSLSDALHVTLSGTHLDTRVSIRDASGDAPDLNGDHRFNRFNRALGATWSPAAAATGFAVYTEGLRAPTAIELTCADAQAPCRLPNVFLADPPLKPVRSRTFEVGLRFQGWVRASAALFRTELTDDIQFVSAGGAATNAGFFRNVGRTRRAGIEAGVEWKMQRFVFNADYMRLEATYGDPLTVFSPNNSSADADGDIAVRAGARLPGLPRDSVKLRGEWQVAAGSNVALSLSAFSRRHARGDENNSDASGTVPGYALVNGEGRAALVAGWDLTWSVNNLFNRRYQSAGVLGANFFTGPGRTFNPAAVSEAFRTPGTARGYWVGVRARLG